MEYGICELSVAPMRKEMSHESELVSELLFNDIYEVIEDNGDWLKIRTLYDSYEGYLRKLQHTEISEDKLNELISKEKYIVNKPVCIYNNKVLSFGSKIFGKHDDAVPLRNGYDPKIMVECAVKLLDVPYRWGGKSVMGMDCSAFVQLCAKVAGCKLPRDASQQFTCGKVVPNLSEANPGDIAFFKNENGRVTHVGILLSNDKIIHASGKVRIDSLDSKGIYNKELKCYTHRFAEIHKGTSINSTF